MPQSLPLLHGVDVDEFIRHTNNVTEWFKKLTAKQKNYAVNYFLGSLVGSVSLGTRTLEEEVCCTFALREIARAIMAASEQSATEKIEFFKPIAESNKESSGS